MSGITGFTSTYAAVSASVAVRNPILVSTNNYNNTFTKVRQKQQHYYCQCTVDAVTTGAGDDIFSVNTSSHECDFDYLGQSTKGDLNLKYGQQVCTFI